MASAPRHSDVSRVNWVKLDVWGPHVSDTGLVWVFDRWGRSTLTCPKSMLTHGARKISTNLSRIIRLT